MNVLLRQPYFKSCVKSAQTSSWPQTFYRNVSRHAIGAHVSHPRAHAFGRSDQPLEYITIGESLKKQVKRNPSKVAIISNHQNMTKTFAEFNTDVNKLAKSLVEELGLKKGDVVGLWSANCYEWPLIQHAVARIGVINCHISPAYKGLELEYVLQKAKPKVLFMPSQDSPQSVINDFHGVLRSFDFKEARLDHIVLVDGPDCGEMGRIKTHRLATLLRNDGSLSEDSVGCVDPDDGAVLLFTSGTTGRPKGALVSHFTLINNARINIGSKQGVPENNETRICLPLPLFHAFGGILGSLSMTTKSATLVLSGHRYEPKSVVDSISKYNCTDLWAVPTMLIDVLNYCQKNNIKLDSLRMILTGATSVHPKVVENLKGYFSNLTKIGIGYGTTENGALALMPNPDTSQAKMNVTVGTPLDHTEAKVVDVNSRRTVKIGEKGELLTRGHNQMMRYWDEPEKTAEAFESGWYKTGDLAIMDEEGYLKIEGRTKELIIRGGANIYPREVEEVLHSHPDILEAAVCGVPSEKYGEEVCAWIKLKDPQAKEPLKAVDVKQFLKDKISYYKNPRYVLFVDSFPMTPSGKVQKFIMTSKSCEALNIKVELHLINR